MRKKLMIFATLSFGNDNAKKFVNKIVIKNLFR